MLSFSSVNHYFDRGHFYKTQFYSLFLSFLNFSRFFMKICFISDTHSLHEQMLIPEADILIHAGDLSSRGERGELQVFLDWFAALPHPHKVFIGGNHDFFLEEERAAFLQMVPDNLIYLENEQRAVAGIKIWGSPITPYFFNFAFNRHRGKAIRCYWDEIPTDTDILVTHGPPFGIGDRTVKGISAGCEELLEVVKNIQPRYHVFGHIHEAYGVYQQGGTTFVNASLVDLHYRPIHAPIVVTWE